MTTDLKFPTSAGSARKWNHLILLIDRLVDCLQIATSTNPVRRGIFERINGIMAETQQATMDLDQETMERFTAEWRRVLHPYFLQAPAIKRAFEKPLGYAGDYEIMKMAYRNQTEGNTNIGKMLHQWFNTTKSATAVRARRRWILNAIEAHGANHQGDHFKLASIASGPGYELGDFIKESFLARNSEITCLDQDVQSLDSAKKTFEEAMEEVGTNCPTVFINESVRTLIKEPRKLPPQNFIYTLGLYDYLEDKAAQLLTATLYSRLLPGGQMIIGNYSTEADARFVMELIMEWKLIYRSPDDLMKIASTLPEGNAAMVTSESTGMQLFLIVNKPI